MSETGSIRNTNARISLWAALITYGIGAVGFFMEWWGLYYSALLTAVAAVITGHLARRQIRKTTNLTKDSRKALAGLILGYVFVIVVGIARVLLALLLASVKYGHYDPK